MNRDDAENAADRVIEYLGRCGEADIEAGVGAIFGLHSRPGPEAFRAAIIGAILSEDGGTGTRVISHIDLGAGGGGGYTCQGVVAIGGPDPLKRP